MRNLSKRIGKLSFRDSTLVLSGAVLTLTVVGVLTYLHHAQVPLKPISKKITIPWIPATVKYWHEPIEEMAATYRIDPNLVAIIMTLESGGYAKADSGQAAGLMQITPLTAKDIASKYLKVPVTGYKLTDPRTSIEFGAAYLSYLRDTFGNWQQGPSWNSTVELVAAGYNGGPGAAGRLDAGRGLTDTQTVIYSRDAFNMWRERFAHDSPTFDRWKERGGSRLIQAAQKAHQ
jgi:soluble lytic murein transglycosylase-like protein